MLLFKYVTVVLLCIAFIVNAEVRQNNNDVELSFDFIKSRNPNITKYVIFLHGYLGDKNNLRTLATNSCFRDR